MLPAIPLGAASPSFAFWFIALTLVTIFGALGALAQNLGLFLTLGTLAAGSALTAAGFWAGSLGTLRARCRRPHRVPGGKNISWNDYFV